MKESYDFSKGTKNPYRDKLETGYTVTVHHSFNEDKENQEDAGKEILLDRQHQPQKQA